MGRTDLFSKLQRVISIGRWCDATGASTSEGVDVASARTTRRGLLGAAARGAVAIGAASIVGAQRAQAAPPGGGTDVVIVGGGIAGLSCAYQLQGKGINATIYEGADRVGGRMWSMGGQFAGPVQFPGQVVERGGELIDTLHTTIRGYATSFGLQMERVDDLPGEVFYYVNGQRYTEAQVVEEWRAFVPALRADLQTLGAPTADSFTAADRALDLMNLADYLRTRGCGPVLRGVIETAYVGEYGRELAEQSCLSFLMFVHADRRSKYDPFGIFSNERYHIIGGNEQVTKGLRERLANPVTLGHKLIRAQRLTTGQVQLTFDAAGRTVTRRCDAVVLAIPFSTLRNVDLDASLGLPAWKTAAISQFVYGMNAKTMIGFDSRPWATAGCAGAIYANGLRNVQVAWETNPSLATPTRGVITDYAGGVRGATLDPRQVQRQVRDFLGDLEWIVPGSQAAASRLPNGDYRAHLEHWPTNPLALGSYTCNHPGYFTTIEGRAATPVGNVFFAGEHTNSFYEWQGFMEGGALSGLAAAGEIVTRVKRGAL